MQSGQQHPGINFAAFRAALGTDPHAEVRLSGKVVPPLPDAPTLSLHTFRKMVDEQVAKANAPVSD